MLEVFSLTLGKVGLLLSYIGIGYYFRRRHQLPDESGHVLSLLLTLLFLPCYTIRNYSQNMRAEVLVQKLTILGAGTGETFGNNRRSLRDGEKIPHLCVYLF